MDWKNLSAKSIVVEIKKYKSGWYRLFMLNNKIGLHDCEGFMDGIIKILSGNGKY